MMGLSVLHPGLLIAGLLCVSIPILVHLLRRKHRPISWGAMRFLEQAYKKRRRLITLEQLILLLTRCAIILCIAGAVGSLILGSGSQDQRGRTIVFVIDNSIHSAGLLESGEQSIEYQRRRALELLRTLDPTKGDRAALITAAAPARGDAIPATSELGLVRSRIESIEATDAERDIDGALSLIETNITDASDSSTIHAALMFSPSGWTSDNSPNDLSISKLDSILIDEPTSSPQSNFAIQSMTPLRPLTALGSLNNASLSDEIQGVRIELSRSDASTTYQSRIELSDPSSGDQLSLQELQWEAGQSSKLVTIPLGPDQMIRSRGGWAVVRASLVEDDLNPRDNTRTTGFPIRNEMRVGIIDTFTDNSMPNSIRASRWVRAALGADEGVISVQMIEARIAEDRIDPSLDALFILAPASLSDRGWARVQSLHGTGMPIVLTADAGSLSLEWTNRLNELSSGLLDEEVGVISFGPPIGLSSTLTTDGTAAPIYLAGIEQEYPRLASSVLLSRSLVLEPGPNANVMLMDSAQNPIAIATRPASQDGSGPIVLFGLAFDVQWTDLQARPLFVALLHELTRTLISQSQSPMMLTAGEHADINAELERLTGGDAEADLRNAGVYVQVDELGSGQRGVLINPDARHTTLDPTELQNAQQLLANQLGDLTVQDLGELDSLADGVFTDDHDLGKSISLLLFGIALVLGILDFVLARRCSYRAVHTAGSTGVAA